MKVKPYITAADEQNYFVDKIEIGFYRYFKGNRFKGLTMGDTLERRFPVGKTGTDYLIRMRRSGCLMTCARSFNLNRIAREILADKFPAIRVRTRRSYEDNVIPSAYRVAMEEAGISIPEVRNEALLVLTHQIKQFRKAIQRSLATDCGLLTDRKGIGTSLRAIEICHDILTQPEIEIAKDSNIRAALFSVVTAQSKGRFIDSTGKTNLPLSAKVLPVSADPVAEDKKPYRIHMLFADGSTGIIYRKEQTKQHAINRCERRFNRGQFKKYIPSTVIQNAEDLGLKVETLANVSFKSFLPVLGGRRELSDKRLEESVRQLCRKYYNHLWHEAFEALAKGSRAIHTGRSGPSDKRLIRKTRELSGLGIFIRQKRRGVYELDWKWIKKNGI